MTDDFLTRLTAADAGEVKPASAVEAELQAELEPAVGWLRARAPVNGIDLVPIWRQLLAEEQAKANATSTNPSAKSGRRRSARMDSTWNGGWMRFAATLLAGMSLGLASMWSLAGSGQSAVVAPAPHYTAEQGRLMFALLGEAAPAPSLARQASLDLARCVACHDAALKDRLTALVP